VTIIGTGGTIASYVDYRTGAVHPALSAEDLVYSMPEISENANIKAMVHFSIFSEDMTVAHWQSLARKVAQELDDGAIGVIIPHGTDTMGYTAAALSFMLSDLTGPVILAGAQRSSDRPSSDSAVNLLSAVDLALNSDLGEVVVLMHQNTSDGGVSIHRGTKVRKMHTSARDAFMSINEDPIGSIGAGMIKLSQKYRRKGTGPTNLRDDLEERVALLHSYPGISPDQFTHLSSTNRGIVVAGTGLGHVPDDLLESIRMAVSDGVFVVMTSQCLYGRVNMHVYSRGRDLLKAGVISGEDMLPETALVKLMWVLGQTSDAGEVKRLMESNIVGEISERRSLSFI
jgi:glutamyl-tRNA(Gln) amidotransferase subunit D